MPLWLLIPPVGVLAVVLAARLRRQLRAAAADRDVELRRQRDAAARLRLIAVRLEVATELHDTVAHQLVDVNTLAGVAAHLGPGNRDNTLTDIKRISAQALADLRATLSVIRQRDDEAPLTPAPLPLGHLPSEAARRWMIDPDDVGGSDTCGTRFLKLCRRRYTGLWRPLRAIRYNNGIFDREQGRAGEP
jgi:hypothetical protein